MNGFVLALLEWICAVLMTLAIVHAVIAGQSLSIAAALGFAAAGIMIRTMAGRRHRLDHGRRLVATAKLAREDRHV